MYSLHAKSNASTKVWHKLLIKIVVLVYMTNRYNTCTGLSGQMQPVKGLETKGKKTGAIFNVSRSVFGLHFHQLARSVTKK